jgi:hypothetical protein
MSYEFLGFKYATPITITNNEPRFVVDTVSLRRQSVRTGAQRWELDISFQGGKSDNLWGAFQGHFMQYGLENAFEIPMPQNFQAEKILVNGTVTVNGNHFSGDKTITVILDTDVVIPAGWFITFGNNKKVYQVNEELSSSGTLKIGPGLTTNVLSGTTVNLTNIDISVKHNMKNSSASYSSGVLQTAQWSFIEEL